MASESYLQRIDKKLHEKNILTDYLEKAEKASGVKRLYITLGNIYLTVLICSF